MIRGGSRMQESCTYGSVRGAPSNGRPYRNQVFTAELQNMTKFCVRADRYRVCSQDDLLANSGRGRYEDDLGWHSLHLSAMTE